MLVGVGEGGGGGEGDEGGDGKGDLGEEGVGSWCGLEVEVEMETRVGETYFRCT